MGGQHSKQSVRDLIDQTKFSELEVKSLFERFSSLGASDKKINKAEFKKAMHLGDTVLADRLFDLFDTDASDAVDFREFLIAASVFCKGSLDEKIEFSFRIYDMDGDGRITKDELFKLLEASLIENKFELAPAQIRALVEATFAEADVNKDDTIDLAEYRAMVQKHPSMLKSLTLSSPLLSAATTAP